MTHEPDKNTTKDQKSLTFSFPLISFVFTCLLEIKGVVNFFSHYHGTLVHEESCQENPPVPPPLTSRTTRSSTASASQSEFLFILLFVEREDVSYPTRGRNFFCCLPLSFLSMVSPASRYVCCRTQKNISRMLRYLSFHPANPLKGGRPITT